ncbi:MAG: flagellar basal body rod protein FlgB [Anaerolineae bacterium]
MKIFNDIGFRALSTALDGLSLRQRVTSNNIANVDTPGYKAQFVSFEEQLQRALHAESTDPAIQLSATNAAHLQHSPTSGTVLPQVDGNASDLRNDANNVDIDLEMTTLAETTLRYQALAQLTSNKLGLLKNIVRGGR